MALLSEFDRVNAASEKAEGFIWRLCPKSGNGPDLVALDERTFLTNLSVWDTVMALQNFAYHGPHAVILRKRHEWLQKFDSVIVALWWIAAGETPTIEDAKGRLALLARRGPHSDVFTFGRIFPAPA